MTQELRKQTFFRWLKEKNVFAVWKYNVINQHRLKTFTTRLSSHTYSLVDYSFCWSDTPQGHDFWRKLDDEWDDFVFENWIHFQMI